MGPPSGREIELAAIMAAIAGGDQAAVFTLRDRFEGELTRAIRVVAARRNARLGATEVHDLVTDLAIEIGDLAGSWQPGKAPPWVWARHRVAALVDRHIGQYTRPLDVLDLEPREEPPAAPAAELEVLVLLEHLAQHDPTIATFHQALAMVASPRDQMVFMEAAVQVSLGDPSPAVTVGELHSMAPTAVRQQVHRVRARIQELAERDPRYAVLSGLALVA